MAHAQTDLQCPACPGKPLIPCTFRGVTVDVCGRCHGIWCDFGELKLLEESDSLYNIDLAFKGTHRKGDVRAELAAAERACPVDGQTMDRHDWSGDSEIVLDFCPACWGTWLDAGELEGYVEYLKRQQASPEKFSPEEIARAKAWGDENRQEMNNLLIAADQGFLSSVFRMVGRLQRSLTEN